MNVKQVQMKNVLVLCSGNSCRSQMAEAWIRYYSGEEVNVQSAGIKAFGLNDKAIKVMADAMIDISGYRSKTVSELPQTSFDYIITLCDDARDNCPAFPGGAVKLHRSFPDPAKFEGSDEEVLHRFSGLRDSIEDYCFDFVHSYIRPLIPEDLEDIVKL